MNSLPNTTSVNGHSSLWVSSAVEKALGLKSATATNIDGAVGFGTQISGSLLVGVALVADGAGFHIPRGYLYFAIAFSLLVEMLNIRARERAERSAAQK